ncbi:MAG: OmpA family protein [Bacteroidota bacterium]
MRLVWQLAAFSLVILFGITPEQSAAQETIIPLDNASFEDIPRHSREPRYWTDCGWVTESPPDVQPDLTFQVTKQAYQGNTYLGMVTRDNDTWESVGQLLNQPLQEGQCYEFSMKLARSLSYYSVSREKNLPANYIEPVKLRIWAGFGMCDKREMLDESPLVVNTDWREFKFKFEPSGNYTHFILEAFYKTPSLFPTNGNLLLDDASNIKMIPCDKPVPDGPQEPEPTDQPLASADVTPRSPTPVTPDPPSTSPSTPQPNQPQVQTSIAGVNREEMERGATIALEDIQFEADSSRLLPASLPALEELREFLASNQDVTIEIGGHTNGWAEANYAVTLSTARAKAVADYLLRKGISRNQIRYKGYGREDPRDTNKTAAGRKRNQRVEIKILDM